MKLTLRRIALQPTYTIGRMYIDGVYFCDTCEDTVRPKGQKVPGETAIPYGTYRVVITKSARFKKMLPEILNVPYFSGIRIHAGNYADYKEYIKTIDIPKNYDTINTSEYIKVV